MEGFETRGNLPATMRDLAGQGYATQYRGGAMRTRPGARIDHVRVVYGLNLPPCVVAQWSPDDKPQKICFGIRTFDDEKQLATWLREWYIRVSHHPRPLPSN